MNTALSCIGFLGLLVIGLGFGVSMVRTSTKTAIGCKDDPTDRLYKWVRAHGNACEYAPVLGLMILAIGIRGASGWMEWAAILAVISRYLHAAGMVMSPTLAAPQPLRFVGAIGTYVTGFALVIAVFNV